MIVFIVTRLQNNDYHGLFKSAFSWCQTYEGTAYWSIVYNAWVRYLKKNHLLNDNFF
jgi:vacuolar-type H+-ATPase subunit I/STV1